MAKPFLIVLSKDSYSYREAQFALDIAGKLTMEGVEVLMYLIEDGVFAVKNDQKPKKGLSAEQQIKKLIDIGVDILAEDLSLKARGITGDKIVNGVHVSNLDEFIDVLMEKSGKVTWF